MLKSPRMMSSKNHTILVLEFSKFPQKSESERGYLNNASNRRFLLKWNFFHEYLRTGIQRKRKNSLITNAPLYSCFQFILSRRFFNFFPFCDNPIFTAVQVKPKGPEILESSLVCFWEFGFMINDNFGGLGMLLTSCQDAQYIIM